MTQSPKPKRGWSPVAQERKEVRERTPRGILSLPKKSSLFIKFCFLAANMELLLSVSNKISPWHFDLGLTQSLFWPLDSIFYMEPLSNHICLSLVSFLFLQLVLSLVSFLFLQCLILGVTEIKILLSFIIIVTMEMALKEKWSDEYYCLPLLN